MNHDRSINYICGAIARAEIPDPVLQEVLENIQLSAFFAPPSTAQNPDVCKLAHDVNNKLQPLFFLCEQYESALRERLAGMNLPDFMIDQMMAGTPGARTQFYAALEPLKNRIHQELIAQKNRTYQLADYSLDELMSDAMIDFAQRRKIFQNIDISNVNTGMVVHVDRQTASQIFLDIFKNAAEAMNFRGSLEILVEPCRVREIHALQDASVAGLLQRRLLGTSLENHAYRRIAIYNSGPHIDPSIFASARTSKTNGYGVGSLNIASRVQDCRGFHMVENVDGGVVLSLFLPTQELYEYVRSLPLRKEDVRIIPYSSGQLGEIQPLRGIAG